MAGKSKKPSDTKEVDNFEELVRVSRKRVRYMDRVDLQNGHLPPSLILEVRFEFFLRIVMSAIEAGVVTEDFGTVTDAYVMLESVLDREYMRSLLELKEKVKRTKGISCPDAGNGFPAELALSTLHVDLPYHKSRSLDDHLFALRTEGVFSLVTRDFCDIDIFQTGRQRLGSGPLER